MDFVAVTVTGLHKRYGRREVLSGINLQAGRGELLALVGPNGAGKTTTVEVLAGHLRCDAGDVSVLGVDPWRAGRAFRERIGIVLQSSCIEPEMRVLEVVAHTAALYPHPQDCDALVERLGLGSTKRERVGTLSVGERRRLDVALALVGSPELLLLDEPTSSLDPVSKRTVWGVIQEVRRAGTTIVLTSHAIDELTDVADRVAVFVAGRSVAVGSPAELVGAQPTEIRFRLAHGLQAEIVLDVSNGDAGRHEGEAVVVTSTRPTEALRRLTVRATDRGIELHDLRVRRPSLEDRYIALVSESGRQ